jgi:hypothetical protein
MQMCQTESFRHEILITIIKYWGENRKKKTIKHMNYVKKLYGTDSDISRERKINMIFFLTGKIQ